MALPTINHVCRVAVTGALPPGGRWANVWHLDYTGGGWPAGANITAMEALFVRIYSGAAFGAGSPWFSYANAGTTVDKITVTPLDGASASTVFTPALSAPGGNTPLGPAEVACVLSMKTPFRGRSYRGRVYLPTPYITQLNGGIINPAVVTAILAQVNGAQTALGAINWSIGIASYKLSLFNTFASINMDSLPDVQRRRKF